MRCRLIDARLKSALMLSIAFCGPSLSVHARADDRTTVACGGLTKAQILQLTRSELQLTDSDVYLYRRPDLEKEIEDLQYSSQIGDTKLHIQPKVAEIEIFDIKPDGYDIENGIILRAVINADLSAARRVAVDCVSKRLFRLVGLGGNLNADGLWRVLGLSIRDEDSAIAALFSYRLLLGDDVASPELRDQKDLLAAMLRQDGTPVNQVVGLWNLIPRDISSRIDAPKATATSEGFDIVMFSYTERSINRDTWSILRNGDVKRQRRPLFTITFPH